MFALDTDTLTSWLRGQPSIVRRIETQSPRDLAITIITVEEVLGGWYAMIRQARDDDQLVRSYRWLQQSVEFFRQIRILPLNLSALQRSRALRKEHRTTGTNDLRIAAISLENGVTLVSRNLSDFARIPGLSVESWFE